MIKVSVIGLGYIGLPTATILALRGFDVQGVDTSRNVIESLKQGKPHIVEPDLDVAVAAAVQSGALHLSTEVAPADVFIIAVPTPLTAQHAPDLSYVEAASRAISSQLASGNLVILESTSPVGTTEKVSRWIAQERGDLNLPHQGGSNLDIHVAHCPERVLPGQIMKELIENDRIIGGLTNSCTEKAIDLYEQFVKGKCFPTTAATAEMAKLTENAFRDTNIAFANELSILADAQGVNVWELIHLANRHPRVNILNPGPGVGGHCIAVDPWFLVNAAPHQAKLLKTARDVNNQKPKLVINQVKQSIKGIENPCVACLGLAFKANVDDLRESPAVEICQKLSDIEGVLVSVVEPYINKLPRSFKDYPNITLTNIETAIDGAHVLLLLTDHLQFKNVPAQFDLSNVKVLDTRGLWEV